MEQNFQTSFIPKKPIVKESSTSKRPVGILTIVSIFIFLAMVISSVALYFYKGSLEKGIEKKSGELLLARGRLEATQVPVLKVLDKRLQSATEILSNHVVVTPIFQALQELTLPKVRFTKFSYELQDNGQVLIKLSGNTVGYLEIAIQSDVFLKNEALIDPVFSNLSLDDKGSVLFDLEFLVDADFVDYKQMLQIQSAPDPTDVLLQDIEL